MGETQGVQWTRGTEGRPMLSRSWADPMQKKIGRMFRAMSGRRRQLGWRQQHGRPALAPAAAQTPVALDAASAHVSLDTAAQFWTDTSNEATPDELALDPSIPWRATKAGTGHQPRTGQALWLRFWITPNGTVLGRWFRGGPLPDRSTGSRCSRRTRGAAGLRKLPATRCRWPAGLCRTGIRCCRWRWWPTASPRQFLLRVENPHNFKRAAGHRQRSGAISRRAAHFTDPGHLLRPGRAGGGAGAVRCRVRCAIPAFGLVRVGTR